MNYYQQGRYFRTLEMLESDSEQSKHIHTESFYSLDDPIKQISDYEEYFLRKKNSNISELMPNLSFQHTWQAITEESIDLFENISRTNKLTVNDAYQILCTALCEFVKIPPKLKNYVTWVLEKIHTSTEIMIDILSTKYNFRHNIHFIEKLFRKFLLSGIDNMMKSKVSTIHINNYEHSFDFQYKTKKIIIGLRHLKEFSSKQLEKIKLDIIMEKLLGKVNFEISDEEIVIILIKNQTEITHRYVLAELVYEGKSSYYNMDQVAQIMIEISQTKKYLGYNIVNNALLILATMRFKNMINIISNEQVYEMIKNNKSKSLVILKELYYMTGRMKNYQELVLANNTSNDLKYIVKLSYDKIDEFILEKNSKKIYQGLREKSISHIGLEIYKNDDLLVARTFVDINSYVSAYGLKKFKFTIYYESDASLESMTPTSAMVMEVAQILKKEYEHQKQQYPSMSYDFFVKNLGCDEIGQHHNPFVRELNSIMRPLQLKKAIDMILNGE